MGSSTPMPERIDRFEILGVVGKGGMGTVYRARDPRMDRVVAIKLLNDADRPDMHARFLQEARSAGSLQSPHIVTVFELGEHDGQPYIVMEFVAGETLDRVIGRRQEVSLGSKLEMIDGLCAGLASAHHAGIVHRDVKPANLIVSPEGVLKILDFGVARVGASSLTQMGFVVGTLNYMSPEQCEGAALDKRSDIFAVGAVFYELMTYECAFPGAGYTEVVPKILLSEPPPLADLCPGLEPAIIAIVTKALAKKPDRRYADLSLMRRELGEVRDRLKREAPATLGAASTVLIPPPSRSPARPSDDGRARSPDRPSDDRRAREEVIRRALPEVDEARRLFDLGEVDSAMDRLTRFEPPNELIEEALADLRRRVEEREQESRRRAEARDRALHERRVQDARAQEAVDLAYAEFGQGQRAVAVQRLAGFEPPHPAVEKALGSLRDDLLAVALQTAEAALADDRLEDAAEALDEAARARVTSDRLASMRATVTAREQELRALARHIADGDEAIGRRDFEVAAARLDAARLVKPGDVEVLRLGGRLASALEERHAIDSRIRDAIESAELSAENERLEDAIARLAAVTALDGSPDQVERARRLLDAVRSRKTEADARAREVERLAAAERAAAADQAVAEAVRLFDGGQHDAAFAHLQAASSHSRIAEAAAELTARKTAIEKSRHREDARRRRRERVVAAASGARALLGDRRAQLAAAALVGVLLIWAGWQNWPASPPGGTPEGTLAGVSGVPDSLPASAPVTGAEPAVPVSGGADVGSPPAPDAGEPGADPRVGAGSNAAGGSAGAPDRAGVRVPPQSAPPALRRSGSPETLTAAREPAPDARADALANPPEARQSPAQAGGRGTSAADLPRPGNEPPPPPTQAAGTLEARGSAPIESPPPPAPDPRLAAEAAIRSLLDDYVAAYNHLDEDRLRRIDPSFRGIQGRSLISSLQLTLSDLSIQVSPDAQTASLSVMQNFQYVWNRARLEPARKGELRWSLRKVGTNWTVVP